MARTVAQLPGGSRISDHVTLGVIAKTFPAGLIREVLAETGKASLRHRDLPAHVVVYYVIALALYMQVSCREVLRCLLEGIVWLSGPDCPVHVAGRSGISQARARLGAPAMRMLHDRVVLPLVKDGCAAAGDGGRYGQWRLVSLDGSVFDVADTAANAAHFGRPRSGRGVGAFPQLRFVALVENATHVLFGTCLGTFDQGEVTLAKGVLGHLKPGMLCLADRGFLGYALWNEARATGADLLWRGKKNLKLECVEALQDGSYLSRLYPPGPRREREEKAVTVRVIDYRIEGLAKAEPFYRLVTTILDPDKAPANELAALYPQRWEIETTLDELKTHLRGTKVVLRSKRPDMVEQEFYGFLMAHFAVRALMYEAAVKADKPPGNLSFVHTVRVIRRKMARFAALPPSPTPNRARRSPLRSA